MTVHNGHVQIATVGSADGTIVLLTNFPGAKMQPSWSPDGRRLAFVSDYAAPDFAYDIYTMNADGTGRTRRIDGLDLAAPTHYFHPALSPDGSMIAFVYGSTFDLRFKVGVMSANGAFIKDLASAGDIGWNDQPDPGSLTWSPDGRGVAYTFYSCEPPGETGCHTMRSLRYVSLDSSQQGTIVMNAHSPSWRR